MIDLHTVGQIEGLGATEISIPMMNPYDQTEGLEAITRRSSRRPLFRPARQPQVTRRSVRRPLFRPARRPQVTRRSVRRPLFRPARRPQARARITARPTSVRRARGGGGIIIPPTVQPKPEIPIAPPPVMPPAAPPPIMPPEAPPPEPPPAAPPPGDELDPWEQAQAAKEEARKAAFYALYEQAKHILFDGLIDSALAKHRIYKRASLKPSRYSTLTDTIKRELRSRAVGLKSADMIISFFCKGDWNRKRRYRTAKIQARIRYYKTIAARDAFPIAEADLNQRGHIKGPARICYDREPRYKAMSAIESILMNTLRSYRLVGTIRPIRKRDKWITVIPAHIAERFMTSLIMAGKAVFTHDPVYDNEGYLIPDATNDPRTVPESEWRHGAITLLSRRNYVLPQAPPAVEPPGVEPPPAPGPPPPAPAPTMPRPINIDREIAQAKRALTTRDFSSYLRAVKSAMDKSALWLRKEISRCKYYEKVHQRSGRRGSRQAEKRYFVYREALESILRQSQ